MLERLPTKLNKEPLIDAMFEMRFSCATSASSIVPGYLFSKLDGEKSIERLPTDQLPKPILDSDPNLRFAPLVRLHWGNFIVSIGDRSLAVSCKMPYPGWKVFKPAILRVVSELKDIGIVESIQRFSMKYIDLIPVAGIEEQVLAINGTIELGHHALKSEVFSLRIELPQDDLLHAVQIVSSATANLPDGSTRDGLIVDIDTISNLDNEDFPSWMETAADKLDSLHLSNKKMFFNCLRASTIESLEPVYD